MCAFTKTRLRCRDSLDIDKDNIAYLPAEATIHPLDYVLASPPTYPLIVVFHLPLAHVLPSTFPSLYSAPTEFTLSEEDMGLMEDWHLKEVGMPIDRRDGCHVYPHCNSLAPPR